MSWKFKIWLIAAIVLFGLCLSGFYRYVRDYREYSARASLGAKQLKSKTQSDEMLVVLTGDKGRIPAALELLRSRGTPHLLISGTGKGMTLTELINSQSEASPYVQAIWEKIILDSKSTSTIENALEAEKFFKSHKVKKVILITSDYHLSRSLALFKKLAPGVEYFPYAVPSEFTEIWNGNLERFVEGVSKFVVEFWKHFLFDLIILKTV